MKLNYSQTHTSFFSLMLLIALGLFSSHISAQVTPRVRASVDTTAIKIGEQITYLLAVEADSTAVITLPEGQTFSPLELVEILKTDTLQKEDRITLQRSYALTQFDSGSYTIPMQSISIDAGIYTTDSIVVAVNTIPVDTLAQNLYDIKPIVQVEKDISGWWKTPLYVLIILLVLGTLIYFLFFKKKPLSEEEKVALLPAYDRALLGLKELEKSRYLIQDEYKAYYSELTTIVRSYLEEDAKIMALESTTDQLIEKLELLTDAGELKLDKDTITQFKKILQTADLVKFAKSKPETSVAELDRKAVESIVVKTKEALPEPTEEDLMQTEAYLEEVAKKERKKKIKIAVITAASVLTLSIVGAIAYFGFTEVKDTVLRKASKQLLEKEWVASSYGAPPISIETPEVLLRQEVTLPPEAQATIAAMQTFAYSNEKAMFTVAVSVTTFAQPEAEPEIEKTVDQLLKNIEAKGAKNIITKEELFTTEKGIKGVKNYGSAQFKIPNSDTFINGEYAIFSFGGKGFQQQLFLTWVSDDPYSEKISERIINAIEVNTEL